MKLSKYNFLKEYPDGAVIFFNSLTCALAIVDDEFLKAYKALEDGCFEKNMVSDDLYEAMCESGAIIDDDIDEIELVKYYRASGKYNQHSLSLTIAPTLDCNFRCPYCFENHNHGIMKPEVQDAVVAFIKDKAGNKLSNVSITWYGGEPLIAKNVIYTLSERIIKICKDNNVDYEAFMITNSSLLKESDIQEFKKYNIRGAQITIDGPKEVHDSRRVNITGESTFDLMLRNVNMLLNADLDVIVRTNVDQNNLKDTTALLEILKAQITKYDRIKIDFGKVSIFTEVCKSIESSCFDNEQYAEVLLPLYAKAVDMGFVLNKMNLYPQVRFNFCCADYYNSYVIDVDGYMYKCWNHVGRSEQSVASLLGNTEKITANRLKWINWNPMKWDACRMCNKLPICMGGCPDEAIHRNNAPVCDTIRYNLEKVLDYYYYNLKEEEV